jgi:hypothetical protein
MLYRILADLLVIVHLAFILFVVCGGLLVLWRKWMVFIHLPTVAWGAMIEFLNWACPLTVWEQRLQKAGGEAGYSGNFIDHYLLPIIYPAGLNEPMQFILGIIVISINVLIYSFVFYRLRRRRQPA